MSNIYIEVAPTPIHSSLAMDQGRMAIWYEWSLGPKGKESSIDFGGTQQILFQADGTLPSNLIAEGRDMPR